MPSLHHNGQAQLEFVHQLVADGVAELHVVAGERQRHAALQEIGDAEQALGRHEGQHVGLLEVGVRRVDDQGNAAVDGVRETPLQDAVTVLGVCEGDARQLFLFGIVVEVDVLAPQHMPVEIAVLNLVLPEVAELRRGAGRGAAEGQQQQPAPPAHRWMLRMRSPWAIWLSTVSPETTRPNTV